MTDGPRGTIDDIGDAVCFLVTERAGAALAVDGSKPVVI